MTVDLRSRWTALVVLCAGMLMIVLDQTIVNVALPTIQGDLGFSQSALAWVVNAYLIPFGGLLLLAGRLGDLIGQKRVFLAGLGVFTLASLACGLAWSPAALVGARFVQGVGGALSSAVILGMLVRLFPEPRERARALGVYAFVTSAGASIGLLLGGVLTQAISWHWIFFVNVPIGALTALAAGRVLADQRGRGLREGADVAGAVLVTAALMLGVYTIVQVEGSGWTGARTLTLGAVSVALLAGFFWRQATAAQPLLPLRVFRTRSLSAGNVVLLLTVAGMLGMFFSGVLYLQRVLGYDEVGTGLAFLPVSLGIGALSLSATARLGERFGVRRVLFAGLGAAAAGLALFSRAPVDGAYLADVLPAMLLLGIGGGLAFPSLMNVAMAEVDEDDAGLSSGLVNTTQQVGGAVGLAVLATLATGRSAALLAAGAPETAALTGGYHLAFATAAALVLAALATAVVTLRAAPAPATREPAPAPALHL